MADEALKSFTTLLESVPGWIADLESVLKTATERQNEFLFANQPKESSPPPPDPKSPSLTSLRDDHKRVETLQPPQLAQLTQSNALRLSQRKRKTSSACSGDGSGPNKYRSRSMLVVHYDGEVQKTFESLVRKVGTCRNAVRKGKMSARVESLSRTLSVSSSEGTPDRSSEDDVTKTIGKISYRTTRLRQTPTIPDRDDSTAVFDKADGFLERAQSLCERAAHQVLRDGDAQFEIDNATEQLERAKSLAEAELPRLQTVADKPAERPWRGEGEKRTKDEADRKKRLQDKITERLIAAVAVPRLSGTLEVDTIEVDDDDSNDAEMELNTSTFCMANARMGGPRMTASRLAAAWA